jgi:hypothetical protein
MVKPGTIIARATDERGRMIEMRSALNISKQFNLRYTERSANDVDSSDRAVLHCKNNFANTVQMQIQSPVAATVALSPGGFMQQVLDIPSTRFSNGKYYAIYGFSVTAERSFGSLQCDAIVTNRNGAETQRFSIPNLDF